MFKSTKDRNKLLNYLNKKLEIKNKDDLTAAHITKRQRFSASSSDRKSDDSLETKSSPPSSSSSAARLLPKKAKRLRKTNNHEMMKKKEDDNKLVKKSDGKKKRKRNQQCRDEALKLDVQNLLRELKTNNNNNAGGGLIDDNDENEDYQDDDDEEDQSDDAKELIDMDAATESGDGAARGEDENEISRRSRALGEKARATLAGSMFRSLNEFLYTHDSSETRREFSANKFRLYHQAYDRLMQQWPQKPIDYLIDVLRERIGASRFISTTTIADVGCGSKPRIAEAFPDATVHSYDLHQTDDPPDDRIIAADMCRLPLDARQCDFAIYSLSLMATNLRDCIREANRILKINGNLLVVEVASRFADYRRSSNGGRTRGSDKITASNHHRVQEDQDEEQQQQRLDGANRFALDLKSFGFRLTTLEPLKPNGFFLYLRFKKIADVETLGPKSSLPQIALKACVYKAR